MKSGFPTQVPNEFKTRHGKNYNGRYANIIDNTEKIAWGKKNKQTKQQQLFSGSYFPLELYSVY